MTDFAFCMLFSKLLGGRLHYGCMQKDTNCVLASTEFGKCGERIEFWLLVRRLKPNSISGTMNLSQPARQEAMFKIHWGTDSLLTFRPGARFPSTGLLILLGWQPLAVAEITFVYQPAISCIVYMKLLFYHPRHQMESIRSSIQRVLATVWRHARWTLSGCKVRCCAFAGLEVEVGMKATASEMGEFIHTFAVSQEQLLRSLLYRFAAWFPYASMIADLSLRFQASILNK
jgi:hypothetical protein